MKHLTFGIGAIVAAITFAIIPTGLQAKTVKACDAEYTASKAAIKAAGEKKTDFVAAVTAPLSSGAASSTKSTAAAPAAPAAQAPAPASKTVRACVADYTANKAAIKASGETKRDFVARCRTDTAAVTAPLPSGSTSNSSKSASAPAPSAPAPSKPAPSSADYSPQTPAKSTNKGTAAGPNQFVTEADAKARCPGDYVVWANTKSKIYHYATSKKYGHTKRGAYMCEKDTASAGFRASKRGKKPAAA
jgi:hypothetical protein